MQIFQLVTYTCALTCLFGLIVANLQFPQPLKLISDGFTKIGSINLLNPLNLYPSFGNTPTISTTGNKHNAVPKETPLFNEHKNPSLQPVLKDVIEANNKILNLNPLKVPNPNPMLPKFVTSSFDSITNVFKQITVAPTLIDTAVGLFGSPNLEALKAHSKPFTPILQILLLLLQALQKYVESTDPKEVSNVLGKIIDVLHVLIH